MEGESLVLANKCHRTVVNRHMVIIVHEDQQGLPELTVDIRDRNMDDLAMLRLGPIRDTQDLVDSNIMVLYHKVVLAGLLILVDPLLTLMEV